MRSRRCGCSTRPVSRRFALPRRVPTPLPEPSDVPCRPCGPAPCSAEAHPRRRACWTRRSRRNCWPRRGRARALGGARRGRHRGDLTLPFEYPVVVKALSDKLPHKTEAGAVVLDIADAAGVRQAVARIKASVAAYDPSIEVDRVLVQPMAAKGIAEALVGYRVSPRPDRSWCSPRAASTPSCTPTPPSGSRRWTPTPHAA
ncbi:acetate--CoA ligase family protein [Prauserella oleivorans]